MVFTEASGAGLMIQLLRAVSVVVIVSLNSWEDVVVGDLLVSVSVENLLLEYFQLVFHLRINVSLSVRDYPPRRGVANFIAIFGVLRLQSWWLLCRYSTLPLNRRIRS